MPSPSTIEALSGLILAVASLLAVLLVQGRRAQTEANESLAKIQSQIVNDHGAQNLRDDIDELKLNNQEIKEDLRRVMDGIDKVDRHSHDTHKAIYRRIERLEEHGNSTRNNV